MIRNRDPQTGRFLKGYIPTWRRPSFWAGMATGLGISLVVGISVALLWARF